MYTPHLITLVNASESASGTMSYNLTILDGVFLDMSKSRGIGKSGVTESDSATLYIPFTTVGTATDGTEKQYISPKQYDALTDKSGYWTLKDSGNSSGVECFFIKGTVTSVTGYADARNANDYCYAVTTVSIRDFGAEDMRHFQVGAR